MLKKIIFIEQTATPNTFKTIFGEGISTHLWNKFSNKYNHSLTRLAMTLDRENYKKLEEFLAI